MYLKRYFVFCITFILLSTVDGYSLIKANNKKLYDNHNIRNYLYGSIQFNDNEHNSAANNLNKLSLLRGKHLNYDIKFITSLVIEGKIDEAANIINDLRNLYSNIFIFDFVHSIYLLKNKKFNKAIYFLNNIKNNDPIFEELKKSIYFWISIENKKFSHNELIGNFQSRYSSISLINKFLSSKYVGNDILYEDFNNKILNSNNIIRYQILSSWNEVRLKNYESALNILNKALLQNDKNLFLKQSIKDIKNKDFRKIAYYDPKNFNHNLSEIFYLFSNLYQQRGDIEFSEILLSVSLNFNKEFLVNNLIRFENKLLKNKDHKFKYLFLNKLKSAGDEYKWYVNYQILVHNNEGQVEFLKKNLNKKDLFLKNKYFDLANYYRIKKKYQLALDYYEKMEELDNKFSWDFFYFKGICYERLNLWEKSEINFKKSISLSPKQYSVINYLAYSWLERRQNIEQATKMLEEAVKLSKWELGYIIDSLGWAYYLKKDYNNAEKLLKIAYEKTPSEGEVYDHYGDVLWMQKKFLQARYIWKNALSLESTDLKRKEKIKNKILHGLLVSEKN
ncbi:MAG: tetratricopeptide repeat protein [Pelagibacteraceae bacterium]